MLTLEAWPRNRGEQLLLYLFMGATLAILGGLYLEELFRLPDWLRPVSVLTRAAENYLNPETGRSEAIGEFGQAEKNSCGGR